MSHVIHPFHDRTSKGHRGFNIALCASLAVVCRSSEADADGLAAGPEHNISLTLLRPLEVVVSLALADAAALLQTSIARLRQLVLHPNHLPQLMRSPHQSDAPAGSAFMLSNQTGLSVSAWLTGTGSAKKASQSQGESH